VTRASSGLFAELKRRKVVRVAVVYAATAFVVLQAADIMLPRLAVPEWTMTLVVVFAVLGFPIALVLGWALEVTPDGIRRVEPAPPDEVVAERFLGKRTLLLTILLVAVGVGLGAGWFLRPLPEPATPVIDDLPRKPEQSVAVLPFVNMSEAPGNEYFSDGVSEEILNALARIPGLRVAARTSAFQFKGRQLDISAIGRELRVAHVLEGSVRRANDRVRISAQLVAVDNGFPMWSATFDRELSDIFAIQDEIASAIATALRTTLALAPAQDANLTGTTSLEAYEMYLRGLEQWHLREAASLQEAERLFQTATRFDPGFAKAHAGLALTYAVIPFYISEAEGPWYQRAEAAARRALAIDEASVEALAALGLVIRDVRQAFELLERAISISPSYATAHQWLSRRKLDVNAVEEANALIRRAFELDPRSRIIGNNLAEGLAAMGDHESALEVIESVADFAPGFAYNVELEFRLRLARGETERVRALGEKMAETRDKPRGSVDVYLALAGPEPGRWEAAEELLSWPRRSVTDPRSRALVDDWTLYWLLAYHGLFEQALVVMRDVAEIAPSTLTVSLVDRELRDFNCRPEVRALYVASGTGREVLEQLCDSGEAGP
jgi:TolB-like protein